MQVKIILDERYTEMEIHVCNQTMNEETAQMANALSEFVSNRLIGTDENGNKIILSPQQIIRFYAQGQKVLAQDSFGTYRIAQKLYELEKSLESMQFFRISKSEIVNLHKIKKLDMDIVGTIRVILSDGTVTYTSRRNVARLKKKLGLV